MSLFNLKEEKFLRRGVWELTTGKSNLACMISNKNGVSAPFLKIIMVLDQEQILGKNDIAFWTGPEPEPASEWPWTGMTFDEIVNDIKSRKSVNDSDELI